MLDVFLNSETSLDTSAGMLNYWISLERWSEEETVWWWYITRFFLLVLCLDRSDTLVSVKSAWFSQAFHPACKIISQCSLQNPRHAFMICSVLFPECCCCSWYLATSGWGSRLWKSSLALWEPWPRNTQSEYSHPNTRRRLGRKKWVGSNRFLNN